MKAEIRAIPGLKIETWGHPVSGIHTKKKVRDMTPLPSIDHDQSLPFDSYPKEENELLKSIWGGGNFRHGYGLKFIQKTGQNRCAYCGALISQFNTWLTMTLDHAIPISVCKKLDIEMAWCRSLANAVLACGACNGFCNRYKAPADTLRPETFTDFRALRNKIFLDRKHCIEKRRIDEEKHFNKEIAPIRI